MARVARRIPGVGDRAIPALALAAAIPLAVALLGLLTAAGLGGCLEESADKNFKFDNINDTTPSGGDGDDNTGDVAIALVDDVNDIVILVNGSLIDKDMEGWTLDDDDATQLFTFQPFTLSLGAFVRVHTNNTSGTDDADDLYASSGNTVIWANDDLTATLDDAEGNFVDQCDRGDACWP